MADQAIITQSDRKRVPFNDFVGNPIHEGDTIVHPNGDTGVVVFDPEFHCQWCVDYGDGFSSPLFLQVNEKGRAVVQDPRTETPTQFIDSTISALDEIKTRVESGDLAHLPPDTQLSVIRGFLLNFGGYTGE